MTNILLTYQNSAQSHQRTNGSYFMPCSLIHPVEMVACAGCDPCPLPTLSATSAVDVANILQTVAAATSDLPGSFTL